VAVHYQVPARSTKSLKLSHGIKQRHHITLYIVALATLFVEMAVGSNKQIGDIPTATVRGSSRDLVAGLLFALVILGGGQWMCGCDGSSSLQVVFKDGLPAS